MTTTVNSLLSFVLPRVVRSGGLSKQPGVSLFACSRFGNPPRSLPRHRPFTSASQGNLAPKRRSQSDMATPSSKIVDANEFILTLSCPDRPGIVHAVTGFLAEHNLNIKDSQQFGDPTSKKFFMRVHFITVDTTTETKVNIQELRTSFEKTASSMSMEFELSSTAQKPRVLIMVSKIGHCLNDLLFRQSISQLGIEVPLIISNHPDFAPLAATYRIPFHHLPVTAATKTEQENKILELVKDNDIDLIVLARYMQVLSPALCCKFRPTPLYTAPIFQKQLHIHKQVIRLSNN